ncbi:MAG TPA: dienelactone hydrolase family protein [Acidimicrobiia bacterium]|nr:dienelactone hydrolase family protein [Acidimicrobiia bacterium]
MDFAARSRTFRLLTRLALLALLAACSAPNPIEETTREVIEFESVDLPGNLWDPFMPAVAEGEVVTIEGHLTMPPTDVPVPLVVLTHGCGGIGSGEIGWVSFLERNGIATLMVDSFGGRGITSVCSGNETMNVASVVVDVYRAAETVADHPFVDDDRIAVMGLSFGGRAALWSAMTRFHDRYDGRPFAAHVAFYPSTCFIRLENETDVTGGPIRIFHGESDDWTPIVQCQDYVGRLVAGGVDAEVLAYAGAHHGFDNSAIQAPELHVDVLSPRNCSFVEQDGSIVDEDTGKKAGIRSPCVRLGAHIGYDEAARDRARVELIAFFEQAFEE